MDHCRTLSDAVPKFGLKQPPKDAAREFAFKDSGAFDELNSDAVKDAVLDLNVATHYNSTTGHNSRGVEDLVGDRRTQVS